MNSHGAKSKQSAKKFQTSVTNGVPLPTIFTHSLAASRLLLPCPQRATGRLILNPPAGCWKFRVCQTTNWFVDTERFAKGRLSRDVGEGQ